jgi:RNA polymerase sporulation-specific sigma factor
MYEEMKDEEIIQLIRENNDNDAMEFLIKKYMGMVKKESRALYIIGAETEDLMQEGMIGLVKAIKDYDAGKGTVFSTFAYMCIKRQLVNAVNLYNRKKHQPLNSYVSFYTKDTDDMALVEGLEADRSYEPEKRIMMKMESEKVREDIREKLSKYERQVLTEFLTGASYEEISLKLGKTEKSIDNAIQRVRKKLKAE